MDPQIYVACLASYNNGVLYGAWISANQPTDDLWNDINEMLKDSPEPDAEEWAVHDYEDMPNLSENPDIDEISAVGELIAEYENAALAALDYFTDVEEARDNLENNYHGVWESEEAFAEYLLDECGDLNGLPSNLKYYFDYEAFARDLFISDYTAMDYTDGVHVFSVY